MASSTRKGAPNGLRLQRPTGGSADGGLRVDVGERSNDPSPGSIYSSSPSTSSHISRNPSFSLDYYALPSPAPQSPGSQGAYPLPQPSRSYSASSSFSSYSQGMTPVDGEDEMGGPPRPAFLSSHPRRTSSRGSLGSNTQAAAATQPLGSAHSSPGPGTAEFSVSSPPRSPNSAVQSRKSSWGDAARRSPLGGFLTLRKGSAGKVAAPTINSPTAGNLGADRRRSSNNSADGGWTLPNRPPPQPPREAPEEVVDISWARKMVEEMEADSDGSVSEGGSRRGSEATDGIPEIGLGVGLVESDSTSSFYGGDASQYLTSSYDRPKAEDLTFSPNSSTYHLSSASASSSSLPSPTPETPQAIPSNQTTPRQAQHASSARSPLGFVPSSGPSSPSLPSHDAQAVHFRPELPHSSSLEKTNRRIHVMEASPVGSPSLAPAGNSDSLYTTISNTSSSGAARPQHSTSPAGSGTSSPNAATGHSPLLHGGQSTLSPVPTDEDGGGQPRRSADHIRPLAFVVPPGGSERSIGELTEEVMHGTGEVVRLDDFGVPSDARPVDESGRKLSHRSRQAAEWNSALDEYKQSLESSDDDDVLREPGVESAALTAARERAARARSVHLASIEITQATSPTTLSPKGSPSLAAYSFSEEQAKKARLDKIRADEVAAGRLQVERPKRSAMRPSRTPSPMNPPEAPSNDEPVGPLQTPPKRMSTSSHAKKSSTSTVRACSASPRRRSNQADESPRRPSSSADQATPSLAESAPVLKQAREGSTSAHLSGTHARTLEELTAALDLAINDGGLDGNLALAPNYGSPVRSTFGARSDDGAISPTAGMHSRSPTPEPPKLLEEDAFDDEGRPGRPQEVREGGRTSITEEKAKPMRMSKEIDSAGRGRNTPQASAMPPSTSHRASDDVHARLSVSSQQSSASAIRKTTSMASLGPQQQQQQQQQQHGHPARQPFYANMSANVQASRVSLAESHLSPTANSFAKTGKWPRAMVYTDIKSLRSPGERAVAFAKKVNELQHAETGLIDWLKWRTTGGESSRTGTRRNLPGMLGTIVEPTSRNVSGASHTSGASEEFPLRQGPTIQATQMRNVSPPSGPPPNLPYPQLAVGIGSNGSSSNMRASPSSASVRIIGPSSGHRTSTDLMTSRPSISSSIASVASNPGGFLSALGRRGSASATQAVKSKSRSPPAGFSALPPHDSGQYGRSELSPRKGNVRGMEISSPSSFAKGNGQVEGGSTPARTSIGSPSGPRALTTTFSNSPLSLECSSLDTSARTASPALSHTPTQYSAPPIAPSPGLGLSAELREMVEILDDDPRVLQKYLTNAFNDPTKAIGQYLMDQTRGAVPRA